MDRTQLQHLFDMTGRVAVVTGGTRGIGRAIAEGYIAAGASVAVVSRNEQDCKDTAEHLRSLGSPGGEAIGFAADMGNLDDVRTIVDRTVSELGGLDVLVNNAGVGPFHTIGEFKVEEWQHVFDVNVKGPVFLIEEALPHLRKSGRGAILNILSIAAFVDSSVFPIYASSKAALFAHTRSAAAALGQDGIRVNAIAPGPFDTELLRSQTPDPNAVGGMTILKRVAAPDEIVGPALMLTSDAGSFMTGQVLMVDGGFVVAR
jgi:NAD(P)-dependent dehydrogenase (short-subunit alcohol dehydrogenase family)